MFILERNKPIPLYYQLEQQLRSAIATGRVGVGDSLPPEPELAESAGVSRHTVRQAIEKLVRDGLLRRERGRGTFVTEPPPFSTPAVSYTWDALAGDEARSIRGRSIARRQANGAVATALSVPEGAEVVELRRVRLIEGIPIALETIYLTGDLVPGIESDARWATDDLYELLDDRYGLRVAAADETLRAVAIVEGDASALEVPGGSPGFVVERIASNEVAPIELRRTIIRGEGCSLTASIAGSRIVD